MPFQLPEQEWVLLSIGTAVTAPRPVDTTRPAARIYGAFPTREDALEHADVVKERDATCSLLIAKVGAWVLFPINERVRDDPELAQSRIAEKVSEHARKSKEEKREFELMIAEQRERDRLSLPNGEDAEQKREEEDAMRSVYAPPKRLRAGAEVRGQNAAAVCVIRDEFGEVLMQVLGCFESTLEADSWCRNVGSRHVTEHDIFVAATCEWFYPNGEAKVSTREQYRVDELQRIMDAAAKNPEDVKNYKQWKKEQDRIAEERRMRASESEPVAASSSSPPLLLPPSESLDDDDGGAANA